MVQKSSENSRELKSVSSSAEVNDKTPADINEKWTEPLLLLLFFCSLAWTIVLLSGRDQIENVLMKKCYILL